jgi:Putative peptidoglycan binding domain
MAGECLREFSNSEHCKAPAPAAAPKPAAPVADPKILEYKKGLKFVGYDPGKLDGFPSDEMRNATRKFQQDMKVPVTGKMDSATQTAMTQAIKTVLAANMERARSKAIVEKAKADAAKVQAELAKKEAEKKAEQERIAAGQKFGKEMVAALHMQPELPQKLSDLQLSDPGNVVRGLADFENATASFAVDKVSQVLPEGAAEDLKRASTAINGVRKAVANRVAGVVDSALELGKHESIDRQMDPHQADKDDLLKIAEVVSHPEKLVPLRQFPEHCREAGKALQDGDWDKFYEKAADGALDIAETAAMFAGPLEAAGGAEAAEIEGAVARGGRRMPHEPELPRANRRTPVHEDAPAGGGGKPADPWAGNRPEPAVTEGGHHVINPEGPANGWAKTKNPIDVDAKTESPEANSGEPGPTTGLGHTDPIFKVKRLPDNEVVNIKALRGPRQMTVGHYRKLVKQAQSWMYREQEVFYEKHKFDRLRGIETPRVDWVKRAQEQFDLDANWNSAANKIIYGADNSAEIERVITEDLQKRNPPRPESPPLPDKPVPKDAPTANDAPPSSH